jgi:predicted ATPase
LSIFIGTFSFDAAKAIAMRAGDSDEPLSEVVNELVAKSLLSVIVEEGAVVYRLLETTRVYALEQLEESGEFDEMSLRRARLVVERMESAAPIRRRASALANIRAALVWCFTSPGDLAVGVRVAAATARLLLDLGLVTECHDWCRKALAVMEARERATLVELRLIDALADSAMYSTRGVDVHLRTTLNRGLELARMLGSKEHEVRLLGLLNAFLIRSGEWSEALEVATQSNAAAPGTVRAHWMLALSHHCIGNHALAQEHCEEGLRIAAKSNEAPMMHFRRPQVLLTLARTLWLRGQPDQALAMARSVLDDESMLNHPVDKCVALLLAVPIFLWRGDWVEAERLVDIMTEHVERHSLASHRGIAMALRGGLLVETGRPQDGCSLLKMAQTKLGAARNASHAPQVAGMLAEGLAATGSNDEALSAIEWAIAEARRRGGTWDLSESLRLKGVILASRSPTDAREVDATLRSAVEIAQRQGALAWELRATSSLTRERLRRGRAAADVFGDLSAVYAKFTEGRETRDLQAARNLLEQRLDR